ncbi:MAG: RimK family alpha-L-glutamate ligase [Promethearchaeota archaeon]
MINLGIITDKYHLERKSSELIKYLRTKAKLSFYIEEEYLLNHSKLKYDENLFFVKAKGDIILAMVKILENETSIPVINSYKGIWTALHRFINSTLLQKAGIPVPHFTLNPEKIPPNFKDYISKNIIDQKNYSFEPEIKKENGFLHVMDRRAIKEKIFFSHYFFYQEFIKSKWEYKIYGVGEELFYYKQIPVMVNPNKMESRRKIVEIPEIGELVFKAMDVLDLKITSVDFLKSKEGKFFLTDINSSPNFNYMENGPKIVGDYLISKAKK